MRWRRTGKTVGGGGQAQVFIVTDSTGELSGEYALKLLTNRDRSSRLDLEISTIKSLARSGARVISIIDDYIDGGELEERPWYVMPIATGGSLAKALTPGEFYGGSEVSALQMFGEITAAVKSVHDSGVAHRDLKPANILLQDDRALLCDLGLCLPLDGSVPSERLTGELERIGSIHYIPKEAYGPRPVDRNQFALDAYALGKILYDVLTGGRTLPGFTSPDDPKFDLLRLNSKPFYTGVNAILRVLLSDDPELRLAALAALPQRVESLIEWASEKPLEGEDPKLREMISRAGEQLARKISASNKVSDPQVASAEAESLADQVLDLWRKHPAILTIERHLISAYPHILELQYVARSPQIRQSVGNGLVRSHHALEPIEDLGYPRRPTFETGCAIGVVPKGATPGLNALWLSCLIATDTKKWHFASGIVNTRGAPIAYTDLADGTVRVISSEFGDPVPIQEALKVGYDLAGAFAEKVAAELVR